MPISFTCSGCGKVFQVADDLAGKRSRCRQCGEVMRIPDPSPSANRAAIRSPRPPDDDEEIPPPPRARAPRPGGGTRRAASKAIHPLIKTLLALVSFLMIGSAMAALGLALAVGDARLVRISFFMLALLCSGLCCIVSGLKLVTIASDESPALATLAFIAGGTLFAPLILCQFVARRWHETRGLVTAHVVGILGTVLSLVLLAPGPEDLAGGSQVAKGTVILHVSEMPKGTAGDIVMEKIARLVGPNGGFQIEALGSPGGPTRISLSPIRDADEVAARITFGKVTGVRGSEISLSVLPIGEEELEAYEVAHSKKPASMVDAQPPQQVNRQGGEPGSGPPGGSAPGQAIPPVADAVTRALHGLKSANSLERKSALGTLARSAPVDDRRDEVQRALRPMLQDPDGFVVNEAVDAMVAWLTPDTVPALLPLTGDERFGSRWHVIKALGKLGDARAAGAIADRLEADAIVAVDALRQIGPAAESAVLPRLSDASPQIRRNACKVLADIGGQDSLQFMRNARPDPEFSVRVEAQQAMQAITARVGMPSNGAAKSKGARGG